MPEKNFDVIVTTEEGEKIHLRPGPPPNEFAQMLGLPKEWEIDPEVINRKLRTDAIEDPEEGTFKEVSLVGPVTATRIGDSGVSIGAQYRVNRTWMKSPRSGGMIMADAEFWWD